MASKWQGEPKRWRVRGKSNDGLMVTLGCYDTETAAQADADKFVKEGFYRNVTVERIQLVGDAASEDAQGSASA